MSRKSKSAAKERRKKDKRARKASKRALYESYRDRGVNLKSKRSLKGNKKKLSAESHPTGKCGNIGCLRCFAFSFKGFLRNKKPFSMPHWMYLKWLERAR